MSDIDMHHAIVRMVNGVKLERLERTEYGFIAVFANEEANTMTMGISVEIKAEIAEDRYNSKTNTFSQFLFNASVEVDITRDDIGVKQFKAKNPGETDAQSLIVPISKKLDKAGLPEIKQHVAVLIQRLLTKF
jgi:hypothetical protein